MGMVAGLNVTVVGNDPVSGASSSQTASGVAPFEQVLDEQFNELPPSGTSDETTGTALDERVQNSVVQASSNDALSLENNAIFMMLGHPDTVTTQAETPEITQSAFLLIDKEHLGGSNASAQSLTEFAASQQDDGKSLPLMLASSAKAVTVEAFSLSLQDTTTNQNLTMNDAQGEAEHAAIPSAISLSSLLVAKTGRHGQQVSESVVLDEDVHSSLTEVQFDNALLRDGEKGSVEASVNNPIFNVSGLPLHKKETAPLMTAVKYSDSLILPPDNATSTAVTSSPLAFLAKSAAPDLSKAFQDQRELNASVSNDVNLHTATTEKTAVTDKPVPDALRMSLFSPRFNDLFSNQVLWMSKQGLSQADLHLNPADMGPITVKIAQSGNETTVQFVVAHPSTKEQIEQALPRLREIFQEGGLQLSNVDVQDGRKQTDRESQQAGTVSGRPQQTERLEQQMGARVKVSDALIDFYA